MGSALLFQLGTLLLSLSYVRMVASLNTESAVLVAPLDPADNDAEMSKLAAGRNPEITTGLSADYATRPADGTSAELLYAGNNIKVTDTEEEKKRKELGRLIDALYDEEVAVRIRNVRVFRKELPEKHKKPAGVEMSAGSVARVPKRVMRFQI